MENGLNESGKNYYWDTCAENWESTISGLIKLRLCDTMYDAGGGFVCLSKIVCYSP